MGIPPRKVLLVDLDPQGNASTSFGIDKSKINRTVYDLLMNDLGEELPVLEEYLCHPEFISDQIRATWTSLHPGKKFPKNLKVNNLWLLPSNIQLSGAEIELATRIGRETRLKEGLATAVEEFDYIIIDTPPSLGLLTINALAAANWILIPVQTEYYALEGMSSLMNSIKLVQRRINPHLKLFGIALTMYSDTKLCNFVVEEVRKYFDEQVFQTIVPRNTKVADAPRNGAPITLLESPTRRNKGSQAYWSLGREVHRRVQKVRKKYGITDENILKKSKISAGD
ncbi:MAG: AAA family ATPase [Candidatus Poseidoniales archaeon]|nr:AAA family ATPase [Candidatus Poseidoniales archaeon]